MLLTIFTMLTFTLTLILATVAIFISLSVARLLRLQRAEAYAIQHSQMLNEQQLSRYLHIISLTPSSLSDTQELRKTRRIPPPPWMTKKASAGKMIEDKAIATKEIADIKAS